MPSFRDALAMPLCQRLGDDATMKDGAQNGVRNLRDTVSSRSNASTGSATRAYLDVAACRVCLLRCFAAWSARWIRGFWLESGKVHKSRLELHD